MGVRNRPRSPPRPLLACAWSSPGLLGWRGSGRNNTTQEMRRRPKRRMGDGRATCGIDPLAVSVRADAKSRDVVATLSASMRYEPVAFGRVGRVLPHRQRCCQFGDEGGGERSVARALTEQPLHSLCGTCLQCLGHGASPTNSTVGAPVGRKPRRPVPDSARRASANSPLPAARPLALRGLPPEAATYPSWMVSNSNRPSRVQPISGSFSRSDSCCDSGMELVATCLLYTSDAA